MSAGGSFWRRRLARSGPYGLGVTLAFAGVAAAVWGVAEIAQAVAGTTGLARLDARAHEVLYRAFGASPELGQAVTWFGNNATLVALVVLTAGGLALARRPWAAFRVVLASGVGGLVVRGLKHLFARARPLDRIIPAEGYSFPSGHAFASTVFYGMCLYLVWRLTDRAWARALAAVVFPVLIVGVGLSRVYLNVHYLTDVAAGWLAGGAWLGASLLVVHAVETRSRDRAERAAERRRPDDAAPGDLGAADADGRA